MASRKKDEEPEERGPNKKEKRSARNKAKKATQYQEKVVDVKASSRTSAHKERRRVRVDDTSSHDDHGTSEAQAKTKDLKSSFDTGTTGAGTQVKPAGDRGKPPKGVSNVTAEDKAKFGYDAGGEPPGDQGQHINEKGWKRSPPRGGPPPGGYYGYDMPSDGDPKKLRDRVAANALTKFQNMPKEGSVKSRQAAAAEWAIKDFQQHFTPERGGWTYNSSEISIGSILRAAFEPSVRQQTQNERRDDQKKQAGKKPDPKSAIGRLAKVDSQANREARQQHPERFTGISTRGDKTDNKISKAVKAKGDRRSKLSPGQKVEKSKVSPRQFYRNASPDEQEWIDQQISDPKGLFNGMENNRVPGAYRRWQRYVNARQTEYAPGQTFKAPTTTGEDPSNIVGWLTADTRGRSGITNPNRRYKEQSKKAISAKYTKGIIRPGGTKQSDRYNSLAPSHEDFGVGIRVPGIRSKQELKTANPDATERELFEMRQSELQEVGDQILTNQREAHETRQAAVLRRSPSDSGAGSDDRVVFFTTSTGYPATSVPANSLLGQYVIKKRKKMVYDEKAASRAQLKGEFPSAVRDQHVIEIATGISIGAQGRYGAFRHIGYKAGSKRSKGYGKTLPVGSQILTDTRGQPVYDRNGNVRYTEGFSRPFDIRPGRDLGLKIYLG